MSDAPIQQEHRPLMLVWMRLLSLSHRIGSLFPRLVWPDDEVDVVVTFTSASLPMAITPEEAMQELFSGNLYEIEQRLYALGLSFDRGAGFEGRDWEWDWSLRGPISVRFRRRTTKPANRLGSKAAKRAAAGKEG